MVAIRSGDGADANWRDAPAALVVAHPGHQVRLHGWLEAARPRVFVLTDGSGHSGTPRLDVTSRYLAGLDIEPGAVYGQYTDRDIYEKILDRDFDFFVALADKLAASLDEQRVRFVAGDAAEGYNSVHDLCRLLIDAAVSMLNRGGAQVASFDFPVVKRPDDCPEELRDESIWLRLDDATLARKLDAARAYYPELLQEVRASLGGEGGGPMTEYLGAGEAGRAGLEIFRVECLRPAAAAARYDHGGAKPFYELHGERQVEAGLYSRVIRYREQMAPIAERLRRHAA